MLAVVTAAWGDPLSVPLETARAGGALDQPAGTDAPLDTVVVEGRTRIEVVAGTEGTEATIAYGNMAKQRWRLLFTAPIDKKSGQGEFANLDGLAKATRLSWEGRHYRLGKTPPDRNEASILWPQCTRLRELLRAASPAATTTAEFNRKDDPNLCSTDVIEGALVAAQKDKAAIEKDIQAIRKQTYQDLVGGLWIHVLSLKLTGGVQQSEFLALGDATISKKSSEDTVWSAELVHTWYQPRTGLIALGARYEDTAKVQDSGTVCPAPSGTAPVTCQSGAIGAPKDDQNQILFVEGKYAPLGGTLGFAISPRVSFELEKSEFGVDVPIYLLQGKDNDQGMRDFVGGIRIGWKDDEDEFVAGIFVGKPFKLSGD